MRDLGRRAGEGWGWRTGALRDGAEVVIAGGPDYFPGSATSSPGFSFRVTHLRLAGEGDLLARLAALRKQLQAEGLFELQKQLARPVLPKTIGVVTAETGAARRDLLAGLERRGWRGTVVWAFAPVQDRHAAPAIAAAIQGLAAQPAGRGDRRHPRRRQPRRSLGVLRRDALPHGGDAAGAGDQRRRPRARLDPDRRRRRGRLLDPDPRRRGRCAARLRRGAPARLRARRRFAAPGGRGRGRRAHARTWSPWRAARPGRCAASGSRLNQKTREIRAASERGIAERLGFQRRLATVVLERARRRAAGPEMERRREALRRPRWRSAPTTRSGRWSAATRWSRSADGEPVTSAAEAAAAERVRCASPMASRREIEEHDERAPESYEAAVERLEQIIDRLDSGEAGLRETLDLCGEGRELVAYCAAELDAVGRGPEGAEARRAGGELEQPAQPG